MMNPRRSSWLLAPVLAAALFSAAKSFRGNPMRGSNALNRAGLQPLLNNASEYRSASFEMRSCGALLKIRFFVSISCLTPGAYEKFVMRPQISPRLRGEVGIRAQMRGSRARGRARLPQFLGCLPDTRKIA